MVVKSNRLNIFCLYLLLAFLVFPGTKLVYAQDGQRQIDTVSLDNDYYILKDFGFRTSRNDTIAEGRYSLFLKPYLGDSLKAQPYHYESLDLIYKNNIKEGPFSLKSFSFNPQIRRLQPENGYIRIPYEGTSAENMGQFQQDRPVGQWFFSRFEHRDGSAPDTLVQVRTVYNNEGIPDQQFTIVDKNVEQEISGSFGDRGTFDGILEVWSIGESSNLVISYQFQKGLLRSIRRPGAGTIQPAYLENGGGVDFQEHAMDSLYTKVMSYYLQEIPNEERDSILQPLRTVFKSFDYLSATYSPLTALLPGAYDRQYPKIKLPVYEPDEEEMEFIRATHSWLSSLYQRTDSLMHISAFSLNRYSDAALAEYYAKSLVLRQRVKRQQDIFEVLSGPLKAHINPEWFLNRRLSEINENDTVQYTFKERQYRVQMDFRIPEFEMSPFQQYKAYINRLEQAYQLIGQGAKDELEGLRMDTQLSEREDRISSLSEEIDELADTLKLNLYNQQITNIYKQAFVEFKEQQLAQYANMASQERMNRAPALIDCLEKIKSKLENAPRLVQKEALIDEAYMDTHLNPYTYTETRVRLYERLFGAYRNKLVLHVVERINPAQDCEEFLRRAENLEILQDFMLGALEGNPGRLDRRTRPQDNPETIIRRLNIPVVF